MGNRLDPFDLFALPSLIRQTDSRVSSQPIQPDPMHGRSAENAIEIGLRPFQDTLEQYRSPLRMKKKVRIRRNRGLQLMRTAINARITPEKPIADLTRQPRIHLALVFDRQIADALSRIKCSVSAQRPRRTDSNTLLTSQTRPFHGFIRR